MHKHLLLAAAALLALAPTAFAQQGPDVSAPGGVGVQGVYYATAPQATATQTVDVTIDGYTHLNIVGSPSLSMNLAPGGNGQNKAATTGELRYATNFADRSIDVTVTEASLPDGSAADFDEIYFAVRSNGASQVEDMGDDGSVGAMTYLKWEGGRDQSGDTKTFLSNFGEVVAIAPIRYEVVISDVALEGQRTFDVEYTIAP